jgi:hypothetical protein
MRKSALLLGSSAALLLLSTMAFADPAQPVTTVAAAPASNPDEIVCKNSPPPTGSRLGGGRECHTQREWDDRTREAQKATENAEMHGMFGTPGGTPGK